MLIAHLPAGYLVTTALDRRFGLGRLRWLGYGASILPDLDLIYFYLFSDRAVPHHKFWPHIPFWWGLLAIVWLFVARRRSRLWKAGIALFPNIFVHLILDTHVGRIDWAYPLTDHSFYLIDVPSLYSWSLLNFILHWTFLLEFPIVFAAAIRFWRSRTSVAASASPDFVLQKRPLLDRPIGNEPEV